MSNETQRHPFFFFNDTATTEIYTLSLHDALPISFGPQLPRILAGTSPALAIDDLQAFGLRAPQEAARDKLTRDRKSTRLNSSHLGISYAVFCLKKKKSAGSSTGKLRTFLCLMLVR